MNEQRMPKESGGVRFFLAYIIVIQKASGSWYDNAYKGIHFMVSSTH